MQVNIKNKNKAKILLSLYNRSKPQGLGILHFEPGDMEEKEAKELLKHQTYFDYLKGRVMKIDLSTDILDLSLYDRDNGENAGIEAIKEIINIGEIIYINLKGIKK
jgi:hypothetical protein